MPRKFACGQPLSYVPVTTGFLQSHKMKACSEAIHYPIGSRRDQVLTWARGTPGARLKRWKTNTTNRTMAKQQEALIKTELMKGGIKSDREFGPVSFKVLAEAYLALPRIKK